MSAKRGTSIASLMMWEARAGSCGTTTKRHTTSSDRANGLPNTFRWVMIGVRLCRRRVSLALRMRRAGLEDKLLRQNIPGRYKQWDRDSDEEEGFRKDEESEEEEEEEVEEEPQRPATLPEAMRYGEAPGA